MGHPPGSAVPPLWRALMAVDAGLVAVSGRLRVSGGVPAVLRGRPLLLAANHIGVFDAMVLIAACRRLGLAPRFLATAGLFDTPVLGPALRAGGHLRVDRGTMTATEAMTTALAALRGGTTLLFYPEGRISLDPGLWPERGRTGVARMALTSGVPVLPISQWGAHEVCVWGTPTVESAGDLVPGVRSWLSAVRRRPLLRVHVGDPVPMDGLRAGRPGDARRAHERIMRAITAGLVALRRDEPDVPRFHDPTRPIGKPGPWAPGR